MKIPIELIGSGEQTQEPNRLSISDVSSPMMPLIVDSTASFGAFISSILNRLDLANDKSTQLTTYLRLSRYNLEESNTEDLDLDLSELEKLLSDLENLIDDVSVLKMSMNDVITNYLILAAQSKRSNFNADRSLKKLNEIRDLLVEQIEVLSELNKSISKVDAWEKNTSINLYEVLADGIDTDLYDATTKILNAKTSYQNFYYNMIPELVVTYETLFGSIVAYECMVDNMLLVIAKLNIVYEKIYTKANRTWIRLISGSYVREGKNILLNRFCGVVTVAATAPPLTECDPPRYLAMPPPDFQNLDPQVPDCPPCITTTTTTTKAPDPENPTTTTPEPPKKCKVVIFDSNANKIIDDDLELFVDGVFVGEFKGSTQAETKYFATIPAGKDVKFEFKFKRSNNKNTVKQIKIETEVNKTPILFETISCASSTPKGAVIWSKNVNVTCTGDDVVNVDDNDDGGGSTDGRFTSKYDCESLYSEIVSYYREDEILSDKVDIGLKQSDDRREYGDKYLGILAMVTYQEGETFPYKSYVYAYYTEEQRQNVLNFYNKYRNDFLPTALFPHENFTSMEVYDAKGEDAKRIFEASNPPVCTDITISDRAELDEYIQGASRVASHPGHRFDPDIIYK